MTPIVHWRDDGTPTSPRFGDVYRSRGVDGLGGLAQARGVFVAGCGLLPEGDAPAAWAGAPAWAVLETGFGLGLNFLATWQVWRQDPRRPARLFYSAVEAFPPEADDLIRSAAPWPELAPLAAELAAQWRGLLPGVHRLAFEGGRLQLTLAIGDAQPMLAELSGMHQAIYLDGFNPAHNPDMWNLPVLKAVARLAHPGARAASWCVAREVREHLRSCGFDVERVDGMAPKRHALRARYAPRWTPRRRRADEPAATVVAQPGRCIVVGAGLAGASVAFSLAQRGWQVSVLERAAAPAAGASGLPAGLLAPHVTPDDRPLSRLTRAGVQLTLARARVLLREGIDYRVTGVLERHEVGQRRLPDSWPRAGESMATRALSMDAQAPVTQEKAAIAQAPLDAERRALWHAHAGWIRPAALVRAMLQAPGVHWRGSAAVVRLAVDAQGWSAHGADGAPLADPAELVLITAGHDSLALLASIDGIDAGALPLNALRGQTAYGPMPGGAAAAALPPFPVRGHGLLLGHLPAGDDMPPGSGAGGWWITGASFERGNPRPELAARDHDFNRQRLAELLPHAADALAPQWADGRARAWAAVRATLPDHLPAIGAWHTVAPAAGSATPALPPQLLTGLGARGLTLAVLCGEIIAAWLHDEPLPVERSLAQRLRASRWLPRA